MKGKILFEKTFHIERSRGEKSFLKKIGMTAGNSFKKNVKYGSFSRI